ncbi:hypothetical protein MMC29_007473 [Sticta canariensis]|nr:hypothetical protein [Sticta canariensis]
MVSSVQTHQLSKEDEMMLANLMLRRDPNAVRSNNPYINILKGILRSNDFVQYAADIPCNIIQTLETDENEAENFVKQIQAGDVPTLIKDLPQEIVGAFSDVVNIILTLPTKLLGAAEAAVTDAVHLVNDIESGAIVGDIESLPGVVVSEVTAGWGQFTAGIVGDWEAVTHGVGCVLGGCAAATATPGPCGPASTFTPTAATPTQTLITSATSSPFELNGINLCAMAFLAVFGAAFLL